MLHTELKPSHLSEQLKVLSLGPLAGIHVLDRLDQITEDGVRQLAVAITAEVAGSLVNILGSPEGAIGNINVDGQASAWLTNGGLGLRACQ